MAKKRGNGTAIRPYKSYRFTTHDPEMDRLHELVLDKGIKKSQLSRDSGVSTGTFDNWWGTRRRKRVTKRPQNASIEAAGRAFGKMRVWVDVPNKGRK